MRAPAEVAVAMQKRHRDSGPDVRVDDHQQELTLRAQHSCHFRQRSFDALTIQVIDRGDAHHSVE